MGIPPQACIGMALAALEAELGAYVSPSAPQAPHFKPRGCSMLGATAPHLRELASAAGSC